MAINRDRLAALFRAAGELPSERADALWAEYRDRDSQDAFDLLWVFLGRRLYGVLRVQLHSQADAEDAFQEVLLRLHRHKAEIPDYDSARNWLRGAARNVVRETQRGQARRSARERRGARPERTDDPERAPAEELEALRLALTELDDGERELIVLRHLEQLELTECAALSGLSMNQFRYRLGLAEDRLRGLLERRGVVTAGAVGGGLALGVGPVQATPERLSALVHAGWLKAIAPVRSVSGWAKAAAVLLALGAAGGATLATWPAPEPQAPPPAPPEIAARPDPDRPPETLQDRNRRVFQAVVVPRLTAALRKLALGEGGSAAVTRVEAYGVVVTCLAEVRHGKPFTYVTKFRLTYDMHARQKDVRVDFWGSGKRMEPLDPKRPIILWERGPALPIDGLPEAVAALDAVPADPRSADEAAHYTAVLGHTARPYLGDWYQRGDPGRRVTIRWVPDHECPLHVRHPSGDTFTLGALHLRATADDRSGGLHMDHSRVMLSADGARLDFPDTGDWWVRTPAL
jgi:RNA polymerase sigma factor (sigma-70 family)